MDDLNESIEQDDLEEARTNEINSNSGASRAKRQTEPSVLGSCGAGFASVHDEEWGRVCPGGYAV